jgi:chemotaxis protein histidine kinase CheA
VSSQNPDSFDARWQELKARFIERLIARLAAIRHSWAIVSAASAARLSGDGPAPATEEALSTLFHEIHSLSGSGATFGYQSLSNAARAIEPLLDPRRPGTLAAIDASRRAEISRLIGHLESEARAINPVA